MKKQTHLYSTILSLCMLLSLLFSGCGQPSEPILYNPSVATVSSEASQAVPDTSAPESTAADTSALETEAETEGETDAETETWTSDEATPTADAAADTSTLYAPGSTWYVNADVLNIRDGASIYNGVLSQLYRGEEVIILEYVNAEWVQVQTGELTGYAYIPALVSTYEETGLSAASEAPSSAVETAPPAVETEDTAAQSTGNGHIVCIDAGHQQAGISETEPNGPGSSVMKAKLTTGTQGAFTGLTEYQLNLDVSLILKTELINRGYTVVMIRESNDCPMSNAERAQYANSSGAEIFIRIHANSSTDASVSGAVFYAPSPANPYLSADLVSASNTLAAVMLDRYCAATGFENRGLLQDDSMTGINWCTIPVTIAEMGFMSNQHDDTLMADASFQYTMAVGLADGIDAYFGR